MNLVIKLSFLLFLAVSFTQVSAQNDKNKPNKKTSKKEIRATFNGEFKELAITGKTKNGAIWLRWSPYSQSAWDKGNEFGYTLTRVQVSNNKIVELFKRRKPQPEAFWRKKVEEKDQKYMTTAYSIYGHNDDKERKITNLLDAIEDANTRFMFALLGADISFEVASNAGLGYIDSTAKLGETYIYTLSIEVTRANVGKVKSASSKPIIFGKIIKLPPPLLSAKSGKNVAVLEWDTKKMTEYYNSYILESSENPSDTFKQINDGTLLNATEEEDFKKVYIDTLADHKTVHYYRVKGIDIFEDQGEYSNVVKAKSIPFIPTPEITKYNLIDSTTLALDWAFGDSLQIYIKGFVIQQSDSLYNNYKDTSPLLPSTVRSRIITPSNLPINVRVVAVIDSSHSLTSFPVTIIASDSIPPNPPRGLYGKIDSSGVVSMIWERNSEKDLKGYYVARRDITSENFVRITNDVVTEEFFLDTLDMKLLNRDYYYVIMAVDKRFNVSEISAELYVQKPDIYGPTRPIFTKYVVEDKKISLYWERSHSRDVASHILYRKTLPSNEWQVLAYYSDTLENNFIDSTVLSKQIYAYTLIAQDDSKNESEPAKPLILETPFFTKNIEFQEIKAVFDEKTDKIKVNWVCDDTSGISNFQLYRAIGNDEYSLMKNLDTITFESVDTPTDSDITIYKYLIRAKMKDGYLSGWKEVTIDIKR